MIALLIAGIITLQAPAYVDDQYGCAPTAIAVIEGYYNDWSLLTNDVLPKIEAIADELNTTEAGWTWHMSVLDYADEWAPGNDWEFLAAAIDSGKPVLMHFNNHYAVATGYDDRQHYSMHWGFEEYEDYTPFYSFDTLLPLQLLTLDKPVPTMISSTMWLLVSGFVAIVAIRRRYGST